MEAYCSCDKAIRDVEWICLQGFCLGGAGIVWVKQTTVCFGKIGHVIRFKNNLNPKVAWTKLPKDSRLTSFRSLIVD